MQETASTPRRSACERARPWILAGAWTYFCGVCLVGLVAHLAAEHRWWSTFLLYVPQMVYGAPILVLLPLALLVRSGMAVRLLTATALVILGPLMGWQLGWSRRVTRGSEVDSVLE